MLDAAAAAGEIRPGPDAYALVCGVGSLCIGADSDPRCDARRMARLLVAGLGRRALSRRAACRSRGRSNFSSSSSDWSLRSWAWAMRARKGAASQRVQFPPDLARVAGGRLAQQFAQFGLVGDLLHLAP
jgi:hypothetical protein